MTLRVTVESCTKNSVWRLMAGTDAHVQCMAIGGEDEGSMAIDGNGSCTGAVCGDEGSMAIDYKDDVHGCYNGLMICDQIFVWRFFGQGDLRNAWQLMRKTDMLVTVIAATMQMAGQYRATGVND